MPLQETWKVADENRVERLCLMESDRELPPDFVLFRHEPDGLVCREAATGKVRWEQRCATPVCWTGADLERVIVGGPERIVCRSARDGAELWTLTRDMTPGETSRGYDSFQLSNSRLFCIADDSLLLGIDVATGKALWQQLAPGAAVRPLEPAGQFNPLYHAGKDRLLIQTSLGRIWLLDSATGRRVAETPGQRSVWRQSPWPLDAQRIAVAAAGRQVTLFDFITGQPLWQHDADRKFTASGEPPQVIGHTDCLLCCIARNYGHELDRLDLRTGARLWPQPLLFRDRPDLRRAALDETSLYVETGGVLEAIALANGLRRWRQPLPDGVNWQVHLTKNCVLAHPVAAEVKVSAAFLARRYVPLDGTALFPTLAPWSVARALPECMWAFSRAWAPSRLPLVQCDPKTGQVLHRLHFDGRGPAASVAVFEKQAVVAIGDRAWGLR